jgi:hypothetical protein
MWIPHYEEILFIPTDPSLHNALMYETVASMEPVLGNWPTDYGIGDLDCPLFHIPKKAARTAQVSKAEINDYRGLLVQGGLNLGS